MKPERIVGWCSALAIALLTAGAAWADEEAPAVWVLTGTGAVEELNVGAVDEHGDLDDEASRPEVIVPYVESGSRAVGDNCTDPIVVSIPAGLPYADPNQTTCGRVNDYPNTCLGSYDGGEDIIYRLDVTASTNVRITMNPKTTTWTGIALDDSCPPDSSCIATVTNSNTTPRVIERLLTPGTYYIMVDTWPSPNCIPNFDLNIIVVAPSGACCFTSGACQLLTAADCATQGGSYQGDNTTCSPNPCPQPPGNVCANPLVIPSIPYTQADTTCGRVNDYPNTCLGSYDGGEDIIYSFTLTEPRCISLTVAGATAADNYLGVLVDSVCPPSATTCIATSISSSGTVAGIANLLLAAGTYYIMVDTWPAPNCANFTLDIRDCVVLECPPGATLEGEPDCGANYVDTYNGGCNSTPNVYLPVACDQTYCGKAGNYMSGTSLSRDTDWYTITLTEPMIVTWSVQAEFTVAALLLTSSCPATALGSAVALPGQTATVTSACLPIGTYRAFVATAAFSGTPCGSDYIATLTCVPCVSGACCLPDYTCQTLSPSACAAQGGSYQGDNTTCSPNPCPLPPGDTCGNAIVIPALPYATTGNSCAPYSNDYDAVCPYTGSTARDVVYSYTPAQDEQITIDLCPSLYDTKTYVFMDDCTTPAIACNDDACGTSGWRSLITCLAVMAGHTYYIVVDGYGTSCGVYDLTITLCEPSGACCLPDYSCQVLTVSACAAQGGAFQGTGTTCTPSPCPRPPGDTCANAFVIPGLPYSTSGNSCAPFNHDYDWVCPFTGSTARDVVYSYTPGQDEDITINLCLSLYDTKTYVFMDDCNTPAIACNDDACGTDGWRSLITCLAVTAGHTYYIVVDGYGTSCGAYQLDITVCTGACCYPDGTCQVLTGYACASSGGAYQGNGTVCDPNPCPQPMGACCYPDGSCAMTPAVDCTGIWLGYGSTCAPNPCPQPAGACCYQDGSCALMLPANCLGTWMGPGTSCDPNPCPQPLGACCYPDGTCAMTLEADCTGVWPGYGSECDPNPCPQPLCLGDADCDGDVDFFDIDPFVAKLGCPFVDILCDEPCPWRNCDINQDGRVDFYDIDPFVALMGTSCP